MASINVNGTALEYFETGSGEALVLVHGSASDYRTWQAQQDEFSQHFRTIIYSRRYHWPNDRIPEGADYSMIEHVRDLEAFLRIMEATPAHLVGHSYGAFVCLLLAAQTPELVRSLVLAEPPVITLFVSNSPKPLEILKLLITRPRTAAAIIKFVATGFGPAAEAAKRDDMEEAMRLFGDATLGTDAFQRLSEARRDQVRANLIKAEFLGSGLAPLDEEQVRSITNPTLLVNGQQSPRLLHHLSNRLEELLPNVERFEMDGASHIMHEDNPSDYNRAILSFLRTRERASA